MNSFERITDEELIQSILQYDHHALGELYRRYFQKVFNKCVSLVKDQDEAFDLAEEALLKAFDSLQHFRNESSFSTWIYIIVHRHCLEAMQKKKRQLEKDEAYRMEIRSNWLTEANRDSEEVQPELLMSRLINFLSFGEKELLLLKYAQGESIETLQNKLHLSSSAVKMRLKRARHKLNLLYSTKTSGHRKIIAGMV